MNYKQSGKGQTGGKEFKSRKTGDRGKEQKRQLCRCNRREKRALKRYKKWNDGAKKSLTLKDLTRIVAA